MVPSRRIAPCILIRSSGYTVETLVTASSSTHLNLVYGRMAVCVCRACATDSSNGPRLWCANYRSRIPHISVETGTHSSLAATPRATTFSAALAKSTNNVTAASPSGPTLWSHGSFARKVFHLHTSGARRQSLWITGESMHFPATKCRATPSRRLP